MLKNLSFLTARLLRITTYQKLLRGEAQLRSTGVPADITSAYRKYAQEQSLAMDIPEDPKKDLDLLRIIPDKGNTF